MINNFIIFALFCLLTISCNEIEKQNLSSKELYIKNCVACHGEDGKKGLATAKDLSISTLSIADQKKIVTNGKGMMATYKNTLSEAEIDSVVNYIQLLKK